MTIKRILNYGLLATLLFLGVLGSVAYAQELNAEERAKKLFEARQEAAERQAWMAAAQEQARKNAEAKAKLAAEEKAKREAEAKKKKEAEDGRLHRLHLANGREAEAKKDYKTAFDEYTKANNIYTSIDSVKALARLYGEGLGVEKNEWKAINFLDNAISWGDQSADNYYKIALLYHSLAVSGNANYSNAFRYYGKALEMKHPKALDGIIALADHVVGEINLGNSSSSIGLANFPWDEVKRLNASASHYYRGYYEMHWGRQYKSALSNLQEAARLGHPKAPEAIISLCFKVAESNYQFSLRPYQGRLKLRARQKEEKRRAAIDAIYWYQTAANYGSAEAAQRIKQMKKRTGVK